MLSIIVAHAGNLAIGKDNALLWHISEDLKYFKKLTGGHTVIMGRHTYESIGRPLPDRRNMVVSSTMKPAEGIEVFPSVEAAIAASAGDGEIFIMGGGKIYAQTLALADRFYITEVDADFDADTFFPDYSGIVRDFRKEAGEWNEDKKSGLRYRFVVYSK